MVSPQALNSLAANDYLKAEIERLQRAAPAAEFDKLNLQLQVLQQLRATAMGVTNTSDYGDSALAPGPLTDILV